MDSLAFTSSVIGSLAWPVTALIVVLLVRRPLLAMLPLVQSAKYGDIELSFRSALADAKREADASLPEGVPVEAANVWQEFERLAVARPRSAIRSAWRLVETNLVGLAKRNELSVAPGAWVMPMVIGALLLNEGHISQGQYSLLSKLRKLVNDAEMAPPDTVTPEDADAVINLSARLAASMGGSTA